MNKQLTWIGIAILLNLSLIGCIRWIHPIKSKQLDKPKDHSAVIQKESNILDNQQIKQRQTIETITQPIVPVEPIMPEYNPMVYHKVSFSMIDESLHTILYAIADSVGMNIIISPEIGSDITMQKVTLNFKNVTADKVLDEVLRSFDLYYHIQGNMIRIQPYQEKIFSLNFLDVSVESKFDVGGDVLGAGTLSTGSSGLSGKFELSGQSAKKGNPYDLLEEMIMRIKSKKGQYSLNRLSGTLFVKDTPNVIRSIASIIDHLKERLSRQIILEARIIEVTLSEEYKYGIDWEVLRQGDTWSPGITNNLGYISDDSGVGVTLNGVHKNITVDSIVKAISIFGDSKVVSNPSIRTRHGKPAIISVGISFAYVESVDISTPDENGNVRSTVKQSKVFDGLILGVIPFIETKDKVILQINPIKSDVDRSSLKLISFSGGTQLSLPQVNIKGISTTISVNNGDVVILGGLIDKRETSENKSIPFISRLPLVGPLFKGETRSEQVRELVIILRVQSV